MLISPSSFETDINQIHLTFYDYTELLHERAHIVTRVELSSKIIFDFVMKK